MAEFDRNGLGVRLGDGLAIMPSAANQKAVKHVLAKRLKLTATESVQVIYDATVQMHAKTKVPNAPWEEFKIYRCFAPGKSASCEVKAADLVDNSFMEWFGKVGLRP
jgi:hypothetical protein